ncbi:unnamed protein product [Closterium sp. NIES-53]
MDVWGPARVSGQDHEHYFLLVVDDYTRYTTVFPLRSKGEVPVVLIPWIRAVRLQLRERFREDLPVLRLHSDRGGEFSSDLLRDFCRREGILQSFTLPASLQQNGVAERRIGLVMEVARTSMIHAAAPHFLWPFAVGDALVFWVWGSRAFVRNTSADKLFSRAIPCVFLPFPPDAPGWQFYHPTSRRVLPSQDVTFDESVPFYRLFPYRTAPLSPPPLFLALGPPPVTVDLGAARGAVSGGAASRGAASRGGEPASAEPRDAELEGVKPGGAESEGAESGGAEHEGAEPGGTELEGAEPRGDESDGAESGGAEPWGTASAGGPTGASPRLSHRREPLSPQQQRKWVAQLTRIRSGIVGVGGSAARGTGAGGAGAAVGDPGAGGTGAGDPGAGGTGAGGGGAGGTGAGDPRAGGAGALGLLPS